MKTTTTTTDARPMPLKAWNGLTGWLSSAKHATVGFSMLRIIFGLAMLIVLLPSFADRHYLWGEGSWWVEPEARRRGWWELFRVIFPKDDPALFDAAYFTLIALVVVFILGFKTRWVTPVLLVFWVGLSTNSTLLTNGGDTLMRIVLVFALFASLSEHFSVDAWLRRRAIARGRTPRSFRPRWVPAWTGTWLHNTALILCCYQILLVYLVSSILKLQGQEWLDGTAFYYALVLDEFRVLPGLSDLVTQWSWVIHLGTWMAFGVQLLFPLALLWKPSRYVAVVLITFTHLGIAVLLGLWPFSLAMIAVDLLLIRDSSWERLGRLISLARRRVAEGLREGQPMTDAPATAGGTARQAAPVAVASVVPAAPPSTKAQPVAKKAGPATAVPSTVRAATKPAAASTKRSSKGAAKRSRAKVSAR
ncbi:HTTM domain-containing protein [Herbiconiux liangxiaofengii]|uniref:HTTM domain-containing protein n=1 Tax=Herbiconiux liangxiaofengii TaxID=3342795 RepID=UPI0035BA67E7